MFVSYWRCVIASISSVFWEGVFCYFFQLTFFLLLVSLFISRIAYVFEMPPFGGLMVFFTFSSFLGVASCRVIWVGLKKFLLSFFHMNLPLGLIPVVFISESISYFVRPYIMWFRIFVNICLGTILVSLFCFSWLFSRVFSSIVWVFGIGYELFVVVLQWFILVSLLSFTQHS